jgi:hypothetical protein
MGEVVLGLDPGLSQTRFNVQLLRGRFSVSAPLNIQMVDREEGVETRRRRIIRVSRHVASSTRFDVLRSKLAEA